jgi:hypothetical protein
MTWHVQYRNDGVDHVVMHPTPEEAIEAACRLIDDGCDVYGIGTGPLTDSIARDEIGRIYSFWARAKRPFNDLRAAWGDDQVCSTGG